MFLVNRCFKFEDFNLYLTYYILIEIETIKKKKKLYISLPALSTFRLIVISCFAHVLYIMVTCILGDKKSNSIVGMTWTIVLRKGSSIKLQLHDLTMISSLSLSQLGLLCESYCLPRLPWPLAFFFFPLRTQNQPQN